MRRKTCSKAGRPLERDWANRWAMGLDRRAKRPSTLTSSISSRRHQANEQKPAQKTQQTEKRHLFWQLVATKRRSASADSSQRALRGVGGERSRAVPVLRRSSKLSVRHGNVWILVFACGPADPGLSLQSPVACLVSEGRHIGRYAGSSESCANKKRFVRKVRGLVCALP